MYVFSFTATDAEPDVCHKAWPTALKFAEDVGLIEPGVSREEMDVRLIGSNSFPESYRVDFVKMSGERPMPEIVLLAICGIIKEDGLDEFTVHRLANCKMYKCHYPATTPAQHLESVMARHFTFRPPANIGNVTSFKCDDVPVIIVELMDDYASTRRLDDEMMEQQREKFHTVD